jgi:hypothetical protein
MTPSSNVRLVSLNDVPQWRVVSFLSCRIADALQHKPRRLLRNAEVLCHLCGWDALLQRSQKIDGEKPLLKRQTRLLKDCACTNAELLSAFRALVDVPCLQKIRTFVLAMRTRSVSIPTSLSEIINATLFILKVLLELDEVNGFGH